MTLRMALLLVSLIIIGLIGLVCHFRYRQLNPKKRLRNPGNVSPEDTSVDEDVNMPFINENLVSDIPESAESLLKSPEPQLLDVTLTPELKTSIAELDDKKNVARSIAADLLPVYDLDDDSDELVFEHVAIVPNVKKPAAEIQAWFEKQPARLKNNILLSATIKKQAQFKPLGKIKAKHNITHLKSVYKLKQKSGLADEAGIKEYEGFVEALSNHYDCEYQFAMTTDQVINACRKLKSFIKDHDLIVILYILAKPESTFTGEDFKDAVTDAGLVYGEYKFFHFYSESNDKPKQKIFSIANMYKPGSFDLDSLDKFSTMGFCAFMVPALVKDPVAGFSEMCKRCNQIADDLSGVLTTNQRELLNEENYKHICNRIIEQKARLDEKGIKNGSEIAIQVFS